MKIVLIVVLGWLLIGLIINRLTSPKNIFYEKLTKSEKEDLRFDLIVGPIGMFFYLWEVIKIILRIKK